MTALSRVQLRGWGTIGDVGKKNRSQSSQARAPKPVAIASIALNLGPLDYTFAVRTQRARETHRCGSTMRLSALWCLAAAAAATATAATATAATATGADYYGEDTWVVVVGASRYFANYRHAGNALAVRKAARRFGVPRDRILVLLAEDPTLDARNPMRGEVYLHANQKFTDNLAIDDDGTYADVDYANEEVTPELVRNLLTGRYDSSTPKSKRLDSNEHSNLFVYLTGHGGDEFLKFHDADELSAKELALTFAEMRAKRRFKRCILVVDTCQAGSLFKYLDNSTSGILAMASAKLGENAYASPADATTGVALADRFTEQAIRWLSSTGSEPGATWGHFVHQMTRARTGSTLEVYDKAWGGPGLETSADPRLPRGPAGRGALADVRGIVVLLF